jgi:hypothetical protein
MSWQHAIRAGSWVCSQVKNESIAASRWLQVDAEFPGDGGGVDLREGEPLGRDGPLVAEIQDQQFERVTVGGDGVG